LLCKLVFEERERESKREIDREKGRERERAREREGERERERERELERGERSYPKFFLFSAFGSQHVSDSGTL